MSALSANERFVLDTLRSNPPLALGAVELCWRTHQAANPSDYLAAALPSLLLTIGGAFAVFAEAI